jgi:hypothetical protein
MHATTHSGIQFNLRHPLPSMVTVEDVAWHLAHINRYNGATSRACSVAEHSLLVTEILERDYGISAPQVLRCALLHDAHEFVLGDITSPVKELLGAAWEEAERPILRAVRQHFGIDRDATTFAALIKQADLIAQATERRDLLPHDHSTPPCLIGVQAVQWIDLRDRAGMDEEDWRQAFLARHEELADRLAVMGVAGA